MAQLMMDEKSMRDVFGEEILSLAQTDSRVYALDGDLANSTKINSVAENFPEKFLQMGIAEQNMIGVAAGMASVGLRLGMFIAIGIALSIVAATFSRKANPVIENDSSIIITIIVAGLGIVLFITYFTGQHKWDQNEMHYQELLYKKQQQEAQQADKQS